MAWDCGKYKDFLFDRAPHFDEDVLRDWYPTDDAWVGQTLVGTWDAFTGDTHVYDRIHVGMPDETGCWQTIDTSGCVGTPCAPPERTIGWGSTRKTYGKERRSYITNLLCFDQINSKAKAKEQFSMIIQGLKEVTKMVNSNWMRTWALRGAETLNIAGSAGLTTPIDENVFGTGTGCNSIVLPSNAYLPTSKLTVEYLMTFYESLQFTGYFKSKYVPTGMFKTITDPITARDLREGNPALTNNFRFSDFAVGGELFKYGISTAVGNFGIMFDPYPLRFVNLGAGNLKRVYPWDNVPATIGIKPEVADVYRNAPYQITYIWHPEAMRVLAAELRPVSAEMPFLVRDLAGKWRFFGPESDALVVTDPTSGTTCTIDNKRRNQGAFWADFERGVRYERPELVRAILHLREGQCVVDQPRCAAIPSYSTQSFTQNPVCSV